MKLHASTIEQKQKLEKARADRDCLQREIDDILYYTNTAHVHAHVDNMTVFGYLL